MQTPIYGEENPQFINYMAPGIMVVIIFTITIGLTGLMFVIEKKEGLLDRSWVAGVHTIEIMMAHITAKLAIMAVQITLLLLISNLVFGIIIKGPIIMAALLLLLQGFTGMSYGLALSAGANDETEVMQISIGSVFPAMLISGIIWPLNGMPQFMQYVSYVSPLTYSAEAMRAIMSRGWSITYATVWLGIGTSLAWSLLFNIIALVLFSF
jgi:ABC-type multidrug transport system permease subunit